MGGKLFNAKRMTKDEYNYVTGVVTTWLYGHCEFVLPDNLSDKKDFGDLDVIINSADFEKFCNNVKDDSYVKIIERKGHSFYLEVDEIDKFRVQVDFIVSNNLQYAKWYYSYGDFNNLLGKIANQYDCKLKDDGLYYRYNATNDIFLTDETDLIEHVFDIDLEFNMTKIGLFKAIYNSKYYQYKAFDFDNMNHRNRKRNSKRPMFLEFQQWLKENDTKEVPENIKTDFLYELSIKFDFGFELYHLAETESIKNNVSEIIRKRFSSNIIKDVYNLDSWNEAGNIKRVITDDILFNFYAYEECIDAPSCSFVFFNEHEEAKLKYLIFGDNVAHINLRNIYPNDECFIVNKSVLLWYNLHYEIENVVEFEGKVCLVDLLNYIRKWKK